MDTSLNKQPTTPETVWAMLRELAERQAETDRQIRQVSQQLGGISNNQGRFAEEYFFNSFEKGKRNFFGEKFDDIKKNLKGINTDEDFDIVMLNRQSVGIVDVKYKAHVNDVPEVLRKAYAFRANFTKYKRHKI